MPENDFEKNVKDKMDGFNLSPSEELWNKVETRIRKDKKRRVIFWWPLALLLLGGGTGLAIWLAKNNSNNVSTPVTENNSSKVESNNKPVDKVVVDEPVKEPAVASIENPKLIIPAEKQTKLTRQVNPSRQTIVEREPVLNSAKELVEAKKESTIVNKKPIEATSEVIVKENQVTVTKPDPKELTKEQVVEKKTTEPVKGTVADKIEEMKPVAENKKIKVQQPKQWGLEISAGSSAIVDPLRIMSNRDIFASPSVSGQFASYHRPMMKPSLSISVQAFWKHRLSPRLDLVAAAGYQYLSTRLSTGEKVDSARLINNSYSPNIAVSGFYRQAGNGSTGNYTNEFHFITLGGELSWRFTGQKANIRWNNGLSYNRLLGSSFLHYDGAIQGYYKDNNRLTKNHLFFNSALSIPIGKKLELHPFASQSITPVFNTKDTVASKFSNFGLRVRYLFNKRK